MKTFCKKIAVFLGIITAISLTFNLANSTPTYARNFGECDYSFLGLTNWDCNVPNIDNQDNLVSGISTIAMNILADLTVIAAYLVLGYVIYGGYLYMFSSGDPAKAMAGKKTLTQAFIGLAITMSAYVIFSAIRIAIIGNSDLGACNPLEGQCVDGGTMVTNLIQWFGGMAGVVAAIFLVIGATGYMTSQGDPSKLQKAKTTILYSIIGLVIVALAEILTAFVSNLVRESTAEPQGKTPAIVREIANLNKGETK